MQRRSSQDCLPRVGGDLLLKMGLQTQILYLYTMMFRFLALAAVALVFEGCTC